MKFELSTKGVHYADSELLNDLRRVATIIGRDHVLRSDYEAHGKFNRKTISVRFGSWRAAHEAAGLNHTARDAVTADQLIADLKRVATELGRKSVSLADYRKVGRWSERPFYDNFGNWTNALKAADLNRHPLAHRRISNMEYFSNIEEMWRKLGRQPRYSEVEKPFSRYSSGAYENRFGAWRKALEAFIDYVERPENHLEKVDYDTIPQPSKAKPAMASTSIQTPKKRRTSRSPSLSLRFRVMRRDNFRCCNCGRSPAAHPGLELHIDHIVAWSIGGETEFENLQTLCADCNLGKGKASNVDGG